VSGVAGVGLTAFGRHEGRDALSLLEEAADAALRDAGLERGEIDGLVTGYATTHPHLMLATVLAERLGIAPRYAHAVQMGGATGAAMVMLGDLVIRGGAASRVLVVAGENRLTGRGRRGAAETLAEIGHPEREAPLGMSVPAYYALLAARYLHETGATEEDLARLAVLMRRHAAATPGAHLTKPLEVEDVMASPPIATPLKRLDCCPVSDGAAAVVMTADAEPRVAGSGQAHTHQHLTEAPDDAAEGARIASGAALARSGRSLSDLDHLAIYDSFTVTLAMLLEAIGLCAPGRAGPDAAAGRFDAGGPLPLNTHGGLLSYGHCGVAGAMAHLVAAVRRMREGGPRVVLWHGDGGVMSSHVSLVLER
jgi:acetyl-CoA acetyltransferase